MDPKTKTQIETIVKENEVVLFMKGNANMTQCGFSSRTAEALKQCGKEFAYVNVLMDPEIFQDLPKFANWPTFPQLYINGALVGGGDITIELFESGELKKMIDEAVGS